MGKSIISHFEAVKHISETDLKQPASDYEIWDWAKNNEFMILTNDEDFLTLSVIKGFPPKVILFRIGSHFTKHIAEILLKKKTEIEQFEQNPQFGLLEIY